MATVPVSDAVSGEDAAHSSLTLKGEEMGGNSKSVCSSGQGALLLLTHLWGGRMCVVLAGECWSRDRQGKPRLGEKARKVPAQPRQSWSGTRAIYFLMYLTPGASQVL